MSFINKDFLLQSDPTYRLYHDYAIDCPIRDYHSHLDPLRIRNNTPFENLSTIWLEGDHFHQSGCTASDHRLEGFFITLTPSTLVGELVRHISYRNTA